ncbi:hypothetical protein [Bacillus toyonensis]|uniref:hypothetical protein n=1 Tax=Bacillus toyonensis TaxID=155322 RepID=UPI000BF99169|nr:hypothetical protein [Bacillus toyonensis]PGF05130.1 hypothetical protein COM61_01525 [Bacillus toyonensis]
MKLKAVVIEVIEETLEVSKTVVYLEPNIHDNISKVGINQLGWFNSIKETSVHENIIALTEENGTYTKKTYFSPNYPKPTVGFVYGKALFVGLNEEGEYVALTNEQIHLIMNYIPILSKGVNLLYQE